MILINTQKGFTLIELLVVIAIIGLLSSVIMASISDARAKANIESMRQELKQLQTALELYRQDNGRFPQTKYTDNDFPSNTHETVPLGELVDLLSSEGYIDSAVLDDLGAGNFHQNMYSTRDSDNFCVYSNPPTGGNPAPFPMQGIDNYASIKGYVITAQPKNSKNLESLGIPYYWYRYWEGRGGYKTTLCVSGWYYRE